MVKLNSVASHQTQGLAMLPRTRFEESVGSRLHSEVKGRERALSLELVELRPHLQGWNPDTVRFKEIMSQLDEMTGIADIDDKLIIEGRLNIRRHIFNFLRLEWIEVTALASGLDLVKDSFDEAVSLTEQCKGLYFVRAATSLARHNLEGRGFESALAFE